MTIHLSVYLAGVGSVVVALSTGFAGGAIVGSSWGAKERPEIVARSENSSLLVMQPREIARVQAAALNRAADDEKALAANKLKLAERKIAADRKQADERQKVARAERHEHRKQVRIAAAKKELDAKALTDKAQADMVTPVLSYAPVASAQAQSQ